LALLFLWIVLLVIFNAFPAIDLAASRWAFTTSACGPSDPMRAVCGEFAYDKLPIFTWFRTFSLYLPYIAVIALLHLLFQAWRRNGARWRGPTVDLSIAALGSLALGCGLLVNLFLKVYSGRPRPRDTDLFGGALDFVQAGSFAGKCLKNCSFISGEASSGGWLLCLVVLLPPRLRIPIGLPLAAVSLLMPTLRVLTGAHYLSDAVLGWLSSLVIFAGLIALLDLLGSKAAEEISITLTDGAERVADSSRRKIHRRSGFLSTTEHLFARTPDDDTNNPLRIIDLRDGADRQSAGRLDEKLPEGTPGNDQMA
jgi:membrane-associated phospholipid phosphatase